MAESNEKKDKKKESYSKRTRKAYRGEGYGIEETGGNQGHP